MLGRGVAAGGASVVAAACRARDSGMGAGGASDGDAARARKAVRLEFWGDPPATGSNQRTDQLAAWNAAHPDIQVRFGATKTTGQGTEAVQALLAAAAAGTPPHVVDFDRFQVATFAVRGVWRALDDLVRRDRYDLRRFAPALLDEAKGVDRRLYALPRSADVRLLYWSKDLFQESGLDPERPPQTWEDLQHAAVRLTRSDGAGGLARLGFHTQEDESHLHLFAWQAGGGFQSADGRHATLPIAANQQALQWMMDVMAAQGGWPTINAFRGTWSADARGGFLSDQLAIRYSTNGRAGSTIARLRPEMRFGVAPPPLRRTGDRPLTWSGGFCYTMSAGIAEAGESWALMQWLVSEPGLVAGYDGDAARAKALGGVYAPGLSGQPALDQRLLARYRTGLPLVDRVPEVVAQVMPFTRTREVSIAATALWDAVSSAQVQAVTREKSVPQAFQDNNVLAQRALDDAWANVRT
jgi:ABC-type glycerol-3-phosphate transport system substrate-binding protein